MNWIMQRIGEVMREERQKEAEQRKETLLKAGKTIHENPYVRADAEFIQRIREMRDRMDRADREYAIPPSKILEADPKHIMDTFNDLWAAIEQLRIDMERLEVEQDGLS